MRLTKEVRKRALDILETENEKAQSDPVELSWVRRVEGICDAIDTKGKTIIAMLGTALLAKATNLDIDPLALKSNLNRPGAYSARSLCQHVLAAHAPRLNIDIGVTGREPLNNQPFFGKDTVYDAQEHAHKQSRSAMKLLVGTLERLSEIGSSEEARLALRAFLQIRQKNAPNYEISASAGGELSADELIEHIETFVSTNSESGKRAQAVGAGLLDVLTSSERVRVGRIHDPDKRFPGDIGITRRGAGERLDHVFEVRDKIVEQSDLYHLVNKGIDASVSKLGMLAVAQAQKLFELRQVTRWAERRGLSLVVYFGWSRFVKDVLFWSSASAEVVVQIAYQRIFERLAELEISSKGVACWKS